MRVGLSGRLRPRRLKVCGATRASSRRRGHDQSPRKFVGEVNLGTPRRSCLLLLVQNLTAQLADLPSRPVLIHVLPLPHGQRAPLAHELAKLLIALHRNEPVEEEICLAVLPCRLQQLEQVGGGGPVKLESLVYDLLDPCDVLVVDGLPLQLLFSVLDVAAERVALDIDILV